MSNLSYCRFRNTLSDLRDCLEALEKGLVDEYGEGLSKEEENAMQELIEVSSEVAEWSPE